MKPCSRKTGYSSKHLQTLATGSVISEIEGTVKKLNVNYSQAIVVLFNKLNFQPVAVVRPKQDGKYAFKGLNQDLVAFIAGFDLANNFNAIIQDNVVLK